MWTLKTGLKTVVFKTGTPVQYFIFFKPPFQTTGFFPHGHTYKLEMGFVPDISTKYKLT